MDIFQGGCSGGGAGGSNFLVVDVGDDPLHGPGLGRGGFNTG